MGKMHDYDKDIHDLVSAQMQLSDVFSHPYLQQIKNNVLFVGFVICVTVWSGGGMSLIDFCCGFTV
jgi:hypothetical protein